MPYSMLQAGCCCAEAEDDGTDPGEGQLITCNLFETCASAGYKPSVLNFSGSGSKLGFIAPGTDIESVFPETNIDVTDVRLDDFSQNPFNRSRFTAFAEIDLDVSFDCSGPPACAGSASGTIRVLFTVECREDPFPAGNRFRASVIPALGEGALFIPSSCGGSATATISESFAEIDHDDVPGTGCVALESVRLRPFNTFNLGGDSTTVGSCGPTVESGDLFKLTFDIQLLRSPE
jgi:hypothetical protein